jgi:hypothetical protein
MPQPWTKEEEKKLLKEIKQGIQYNKISIIHNRSVSALMMRFNKIIYENIQAGKTKSHLAKLLNLPLDKINQSYFEHKAFLEKQTIKQSTDTQTNTNKSTDINKLKIYMTKLENENKLLKDIIQKIHKTLKINNK